MTDPDEPSVLHDAVLTTTVPEDIWARALSAAFDPDASAADASAVPVMDDAGDLPDTSFDGSHPGIVDHADHAAGAHDPGDHDAIDLGGDQHDETHHHTGAHEIDHGHDDGPAHDTHDSGWHV